MPLSVPSLPVPFLSVLWLTTVLAGPVLACADLPATTAAALGLAQAQARVADCHPDVRATRAALGAAQADVQVAGQLPNPQLTVGAGSVGTSLGSGPWWRKTYDQSVRLDQLLERGNKPALRRAVADATRLAVLADLADAQRRATAIVAHAHQDLWALQGRQAQLQAAVGSSTESLRLLDARVRAGDAPALDATRFRLDDARLRADLRQADADRQDLQRQLALLIGAGPVAAQLKALAAELPADLVLLPQLEANAADTTTNATTNTTTNTTTTDNRPDVAAAQARVSAAELARDLAAAARTRDVSVGLQFDHWPTSPTNGSGTGNTISVSVSVPLFIRHANEGELARAQADLASAQDSLRRLRDAAGAEQARTAALTHGAAGRRQLVITQLEPAAEQVAAGAELAYRRGASSALELLDARRSLRAVRLERINADADLAKALADWQAATRVTGWQAATNAASTAAGQAAANAAGPQAPATQNP